MLYRMPGERSVQNDGAQYHRRRYRVHSPQDQGRPWCNGACAAFQSRAGDSRPLSRAVARWFVPVLHRAEIQCENQGGVQACRTCPHGDDHRPANAAGGATAVMRGGIIPHGPAHVYREYLQEGERPELGRISERPQGGQQGVCPLPRYRRGDEKGVSWVIGVIDNKVKLIKYDYATSTLLGKDGDYYGSSTPGSTYKGSQSSIDKYYWNYKASGNASNVWSTSLLNKTNLNTNFINKIGSTWAGKIATTTWQVGGNTFAKISEVVPATAYKNEVGSSASRTIVNKKIGLMYVTDYYYSASPSAWTLVGYNSSDTTKDYRVAKTINWLYLGSYEWTISCHSGTSYSAFGVGNLGYVSGYFDVSTSSAVRPTFNLESSVKYVSGSGSMSDPVRVN